MNIFSILSFLHQKKRQPSFPYRNGKIYDIFTFFNELDLLEIRLNILDQYVDFFVIVEATETFSGKPKPLYFEEHKNRFKKWEHKIIHYIIVDTPSGEDDLQQRLQASNLSPIDRDIIDRTLTTDHFKKGETHWMKEFYQKESIRKALLGLSDDDICFIGDLDEIWDPRAAYDFETDKFYKLRQTAYAYYLNNRSTEAWAGTMMTKYKNIKNNCLNHLRNPSKTPFVYIKNGGWHFTNMGGAEQIKKKIESYGHQELNNDVIKSQIVERIAQNKDFAGRPFKFSIDERDLPAYLLKHKDKYPHLFK
jgi:beta-1,4-mannosyl-glycoprotein beta-1,4-N-acetylglucosaminyltransferase